MKKDKEEWIILSGCGAIHGLTMFSMVTIFSIRNTGYINLYSDLCRSEICFENLKYLKSPFFDLIHHFINWSWVSLTYILSTVNFPWCVKTETCSTAQLPVFHCCGHCTISHAETGSSTALRISYILSYTLHSQVYFYVYYFNWF